MDFLDALSVLKRRWYVLVAGILLVAGAGLAGIYFVPTNYEASGQVLLLLPPQATGANTPTSPYLNLDPGLSVAASLIASTVSTKETQRDMKNAGFASEYAVALNPGTGPLLVITVDNTNPTLAIATRDELIRRLDAELIRMQLEESVPKRQFIHPRLNNVAPEAEVLPGSKIRALAAIGGVGGVLTLAVAFMIDRKRRPAPQWPGELAADPRAAARDGLVPAPVAPAVIAPEVVEPDAAQPAVGWQWPTTEDEWAASPDPPPEQPEVVFTASRRPGDQP